MLGIEFDFEVGELRKSLIYDHQIFTGGSSNKKLIRILPPLTIKEKTKKSPKLCSSISPIGTPYHELNDS